MPASHHLRKGRGRDLVSGFRRHSLREAFCKRKNFPGGPSVASMPTALRREAQFQGVDYGGCQTLPGQAGDFQGERMGPGVLQIQVLQNSTSCW